MSNSNALSEFSLSDYFEKFFEHPEFAFKKTFGGLSLYYSGKMVAVLCESGSNSQWQGKEYGFPIWNGVMIPTDYIQHESLKRDLLGATQHPVLKKWLYLATSLEQFESLIQKLTQLIAKKDERVGILPKLKKAKSKKTPKKVKKQAKTPNAAKKKSAKKVRAKK